MPNNTTLEQDETPSMSERGENFADILSQYEQSHTHKPEAGGQGLTGTAIAGSLEQDETPSMSERGENFADILSQYEQSHTHKPEAGGQGLTGTVIAVSPEQVFIDIGQKIEG